MSTNTTGQKSEKQIKAEKAEQEAQKRLELDILRAQVQEDELIARSHKAHYESMYFYMELRKIEPAFYELRRKEQEEQQKQREEYMAQIKAQVEEQNGQPEAIPDAGEVLLQMEKDEPNVN